jgi:hypothetical protein
VVFESPKVCFESPKVWFCIVKWVLLLLLVGVDPKEG